jgi:hypothetical protein
MILHSSSVGHDEGVKESGMDEKRLGGTLKKMSQTLVKRNKRERKHSPKQRVAPRHFHRKEEDNVPNENKDPYLSIREQSRQRSKAQRGSHSEPAHHGKGDYYTMNARKFLLSHAK